jgi:hypothetical protein
MRAIALDFVTYVITEERPLPVMIISGATCVGARLSKRFARAAGTLRGPEQSLSICQDVFSEFPLDGPTGSYHCGNRLRRLLLK